MRSEKQGSQSFSEKVLNFLGKEFFVACPEPRRMGYFFYFYYSEISGVMVEALCVSAKVFCDIMK